MVPIRRERHVRLRKRPAPKQLCASSVLITELLTNYGSYKAKTPPFRAGRMSNMAAGNTILSS